MSIKVHQVLNSVGDQKDRGDKKKDKTKFSV